MDRLHQVTNAQGTFSYHYAGSNPMPSEIRKNNQTIVTYRWKGHAFAPQMEQAVIGAHSWFFAYEQGERVPFMGMYKNLTEMYANAVHDKTKMPTTSPADKWFGRVMVCRFGADHLGTISILAADIVKQCVARRIYDTFGCLMYQTEPTLPFPLGFAGGFADPVTGFVRFGCRDYDPYTGRFTTPDPLGCTGDDHDLYDYCVDAPVTMNDPSGLIPPALFTFLGAAAGKAALGAGAVAYGSAKLVDKIESAHSEEKSSATVDAMDEIAPIVAGTSAGTAAMTGAAIMAPSAVAGAIAAEEAFGAALATSGVTEKAVQYMPPALDFIDDFFAKLLIKYTD